MTLAKKYGWKLGDRIMLKGTIYPVDLELYIRGILHSVPDDQSVYFNAKYVEESVSWFKGKAGIFGILADSPEDVSKVAARWMTCSATHRSPPRRRAKRRSALDSSPCWAT